MERLILDTGVLIGIERGALGADVVAAEDDVAISAITASELLVGVELGAGAGGPRRTFVEGILARTQTLAFGLDTAREHAMLAAHTRRGGRPRGAHDLLIAATAHATGRTVLTTDARAFDDLPGVSHRVVPCG